MFGGGRTATPQRGAKPVLPTPRKRNWRQSWGWGRRPREGRSEIRQVRREGKGTGRGAGKGRGETGRERDPARYHPSQTGKGVTYPLDPDSGATPAAAGTTARRSLSSPKVDVRVDKQLCSEFLIFIYPN